MTAIPTTPAERAMVPLLTDDFFNANNLQELLTEFFLEKHTPSPLNLPDIAAKKIQSFSNET